MCNFLPLCCLRQEEIKYDLDLFGEIFINEVRDRTISLFDDRVKGNMKGESSQQLYKDVQTLNESQREIMYRIIEQVTDLSIHNMLCMFEDHEELKLLLNEENLVEESDGLAGELYTEDGWIKRYSKQRTGEI